MQSFQQPPTASKTADPARKKLRVGILFGGKSGEHEISLRSARSIVKAIDRSRYAVVQLGIAKDGRWLPTEDSALLLEGLTQAEIEVHPDHTSSTGLTLASTAADPASGSPIDIVFPVLHGTFGEDGTVQGLLELADIAYVGSGVLGSAAGMDKDTMKRLFTAAGLPQTPYLTCCVPTGDAMRLRRSNRSSRACDTRCL